MIERILNCLVKILLQKNQWTDYMEKILQLVSINIRSNENCVSFSQANDFPFRPNDIMMPTDRTGYVYFLVSVNHTNVIYVGETKRTLNTR